MFDVRRGLEAGSGAVGVLNREFRRRRGAYRPRHTKYYSLNHAAVLS
nr:MAG TPA: hypothetical protein [Caudoviricetes sp.]